MINNYHHLLKIILASVEVVMKKWFSPGLAFLFLVLVPLSAPAQATQGVSVGYGFGMFSSHKSIGYIEEGYYNFLNLAYQYEKPLSQVLGLLFEPFASYTMNPNDGLDAGITLSLKYNFQKKEENGFYLTLGGGAAYTSINFKEQGTHLLFILQTGIGYQWKTFFVENRFKHYSNADTASPNRSINSNIIMFGLRF
jgi:hypothetical protein